MKVRELMQELLSCSMDAEVKFYAVVMKEEILKEKDYPTEGTILRKELECKAISINEVEEKYNQVIFASYELNI